MDERRLQVDGVPARLYDPGAAPGLLLLGHRGTQSKDHPRFVELGRAFASGTGLAVVCIDAPAHGERRPLTGDADRDLEIVVSTVRGPQDATVDDWRAVSESLESIGPPLAYVGFSMGAMMGLATVASIESIRAAVLWAAGVPPTAGGPAPAPGAADAFAASARAAGRAEILMVNLLGDDFFGPAEALALLGMIGGEKKRMMLWPGGHDTEPHEALDLAIDFLRRHAT